MRGRLILGATLVVAAYVKGRIDAAVLEAERPFADAQSGPIATAAAETAAAVATPTPAPAAASAAPTVEGDTTRDEDWDILMEALAAEASTAAGAMADPVTDTVTHATAVTEPPFTPAPDGDTPTAEAGDPSPGAPLVEEIEAGWAAEPTVVDDAEPFTPYVDAPPAAAEPVVEPEVCGPPDTEGVLVDLTRAAGPVVVAEGSFALSGLAVNASDLAFGRVMFPHRLDDAPPAGRITLTVEHSENVAEGGLSVMADGGFAPCREGLTLVVAAGAPGRFLVRGQYMVTGD